MFYEFADVGDVQCMVRYGYATASALHGVKHTLVNDFMLQVHNSLILSSLG